MFSFSNLQDFRNFGRYLMKCLIDGKAVPPLFAPSLFKYLVGRRPTMHDLEAFDPNLALRLRFSLAEDHQFEAVEAKVEEVLVKRIEPQLAAIKEGFHEFDLSKLVGEFSGFDLVALSLTPGLCDTISADSIRKSVTFAGFPENSETVAHFHRYLDSLTPHALRMFLYFATSRGTLASGTSVFSLLESMAYNQETTKILVHAVGVGSGKTSLPVTRSFIYQLDLPDYNDFAVLAYAMSSAILSFCQR